MRRGELFRLKWQDIDFERGFIHIRDPKGGKDQTIPLNNEAKKILEGHVRTGSEYVFPGRETEDNHSDCRKQNKGTCRTTKEFQTDAWLKTYIREHAGFKRQSRCVSPAKHVDT